MNYLKVYQLKTLKTYDLISFLRIRSPECPNEPRVSRLWSGSPMGCSQDIGWGCGHLKAGVGLEDHLLVSHLTPGKRTQFLTSWWWEVSASLHTRLFVGCSQHGSWLSLEWLVKERGRVAKRKTAMTSESSPWRWRTVTSAVVYWSHRWTLVRHRGRLHKNVNTRRQRSLGTF